MGKDMVALNPNQIIMLWPIIHSKSMHPSDALSNVCGLHYLLQLMYSYYLNEFFIHWIFLRIVQFILEQMHLERPETIYCFYQLNLANIYTFIIIHPYQNPNMHTNHKHIHKQNHPKIIKKRDNKHKTSHKSQYAMPNDVCKITIHLFI
eukprot:510166_1